MKIYFPHILLFSLLLLSACDETNEGSIITDVEDVEDVDGVKTTGLDNRPSNTSCFAPPRPTTSANIRLERAYENLSFNSPLLMLQEPANSNRWYVVEKNGRVVWFDANDENTTQKNTYLDISSVVDSRSEGGLLSMAFHTDFANNSEVFLSYTIDAVADINNEMVSQFTRLTESASGNSLDTATETLVLEQNQFATNHNGVIDGVRVNDFSLLLYISLTSCRRL